MAAAVIAGLLAAGIASALTAFPGAKGTVSPHRRYRVSWVAPASSSESHALALENLRTGVSMRLMDFLRHVEVIWSPDDRYVAVTDYSGSTDSAVLIFRTSRPGRTLEVAPPPAIAGKMGAYGHRILKAVRWNKSNELIISAQAYGNEAATEYVAEFSYKVPTE